MSTDDHFSDEFIGPENEVFLLDGWKTILIEENGFTRRMISTFRHLNSIEDVYQAAIDAVENEIDTWGAGIYTIDEATGTAKLRCSSDLPDAFIEDAGERDPHVLPYSHVFQQNKPLITSNYSRVSPAIANKHGIKSVISVPIESDGKVVGCLNAGKESKPFKGDEVRKIINICYFLSMEFNRIESKSKLKSMNENLVNFFNCLDDFLFVLASDGSIIEINKSVSSRMEYRRNELIGKNVLSLHFPKHRKEAARIIADMQKGKLLFCPLPLMKKNGQAIEVETRIVPGVWNRQKVLFGISKDLTQTKEVERIKYISDHDNLTGLLTRAVFESRLHACRNDNIYPASIILLDINGFRIINNKYGNEKGNQVLKGLAEKIKEMCCRESFLARWGGDEFAILLPKTDMKEASIIAEDISKAAFMKCGKFKVKLSFGVAEIHGAEKPLSGAINEAENMMCRQKLFVDGSLQNSLITSMQRAIHERNLETEEHTERMMLMAKEFAEFIGMDKDQKNTLMLLATLHDIGKIGIPDKILLKKGKLTKEQWETMKKHCEIGRNIVSGISTFNHIGDYILHHHEKWDGTGYPDGLSGKNIPKICRALSIIDAYDVMTHERPYKEAFSHEDAVKEIKRCSGSQFDPDLADLFMQFIAREKS